MKLTTTGWMLLVAALAGTVCGATGDSYKSAVALSAGTAKSVSLVKQLNVDWDSKEDDPEDKYFDTGAYFFKFTATRGKAYTVTVKKSSLESGLATSLTDITEWDWEKEVSWPGFSSDDDPDGLTERFTLAADDWTIDDEDPEFSDSKSVVVYVCVTDGAIGEKVTVKLENGIVEYQPPTGSPEKPYQITLGSTLLSQQATLINGEYCFLAKGLKVGQLYKFWTTGGTAENMLKVDAEGVGSADGEVRVLESSTVGAYDEGLILVPLVAGDFLITIAGDGNAKVGLNAQAVAPRTPAEHTAAIVVGKVSATAKTKDCVPGRRNDPKSGFWDQVIDNQLYKVTLVKDNFYAFETSGATTNLIMEVYDAKGKVLVSNRRGFADRPYDCKVVYKAAASADYWVGVCQALADDEKSPLAKTPCTFSAVLVTEGVKDAYDPLDDKTSGATPLAPVIASSWKSGTPHGPHTLGATDWKDIYSVACRRGITYKLGIQFVKDGDPSAQAWRLPARVWTLGKDGSKVDEQTIADLAQGGSFAPRYNGTYFILVAPEGAQGVDYGAHSLKIVSYAKEGLGYLSVDILGATTAEGAGWYLDEDGADGKANPYAPGTVCLPVGSHTVRFTAASGWTTPKSKKVTVVADETASLVVKYSDSHDAADLTKDAVDGDGAYNAANMTTLNPTTKTQREGRSLWADDATDWYRFKSEANSCYTFKLAENAKLGDATITVYLKNRKDVLAEGRSVVFNCREAGQYYYVVVSHGEETPVDSQYSLSYSYKQIGALSLSSESYSVGDDASSVSLKVTRTGGSTGAVRVRYTTRSGEGDDAAIAGQHYVPCSGYLSWADGETATKTIKVSLLPALRAAWNEPRTFGVEIAAVAPEDMEPNEIQPLLATTHAEVVLKSATKAAPGTVQFAAKTASVAAGLPLTVRLTRKSGTDGKVGVILKTVKSSAKPGVNYTEETSKKIVFADGETEKTYVLSTYDTAEEFQKTLKMKLQIEVDKKQPSTCKLGSVAEMTVSIVDPKATETFASYAAVAKAEGVTVAEGEKETWFFDEAETLRNATPAKGAAATLTYTLKGPGRVSFTPNFLRGHSKDTLTCKVGSKTVSCKNGQRVVEYIDQAADKTTKVVFTVTRNATGTGECYMWLDSEENGQPLMWKPLSKPKLVSPLAAERIASDGLLRWSEGDDEIVYFVSVAKKESYLGVEKYASKSLLCNEPWCVNDLTLSEFDTLSPASVYYWRVDSAFDGAEDKLLLKGDVWTFAVADEAAPVTKFADGAVDAYGDEIFAPEEEGHPYEVLLVAGVKTTLRLDALADEEESVSYALVDAVKYPLPTGLKLSKGKITGTPTKTGTFETVLQASTKTCPGQTLRVKFSVKSLGLAAGNFSGIVTSEDERVAGETADGLAACALGSIAVTTGSDGAISAKVKIGAETYAFTGKGWTSAAEVLENDQRTVSVTLSNVTDVYRKSNKPPLTVTNTLSLVACRGSSSSLPALDTPMAADLSLTLVTPDCKGWVTNVTWSGSAVRDNTATSAVVKRIKPFAGYYTVSLVPEDHVDGVQGQGYLTVTIDTKGQAKVAGLLADGLTKVSAAAPCGILSSDASGTAGDEIVLPLYVGKATQSFGGWLHIRLAEDGVPVVSAEIASDVCVEPLRWISSVSAATLAGDEGFDMTLSPRGGYYDTVVNLQRYYYDLGFAWAIPSLEGLESFTDYLLGGSSTYTELVAWPGMDEVGAQALTIANDKVSVKSRKSVYRADNAKLYDWQFTVNPANLKFTFTRATGLYSGTFEIWKGNDVPGSETKQKLCGTYDYKGVLLMATENGGDSTAVSENDAIAPGFYIVPLTVKEEETSREVKASYPFAIMPTAVTNPWDDPEWQETLPTGD